MFTNEYFVFKKDSKGAEEQIVLTRSRFIRDYTCIENGTSLSAIFPADQNQLTVIISQRMALCLHQCAPDQFSLKRYILKGMSFLSDDWICYLVNRLYPTDDLTNDIVHFVQCAVKHHRHQTIMYLREKFSISILENQTFLLEHKKEVDEMRNHLVNIQEQANILENRLKLELTGWCGGGGGGDGVVWCDRCVCRLVT